MICIKSIQTVEVDEDQLGLIFFPPRTALKPEDMFKAEEQEVTKEMVIGRKFINIEGKSLCIGIAKEVQKALGLPFEAFEDMNILIERQQNTIYSMGTKQREAITKINKYQKIISKLGRANFWDRLKYLFKGYGEFQ